MTAKIKKFFIFSNFLSDETYTPPDTSKSPTSNTLRIEMEDILDSAKSPYILSFLKSLLLGVLL